MAIGKIQDRFNEATAQAKPDESGSKVITANQMERIIDGAGVIHDGDEFKLVGMLSAELSAKGYEVEAGAQVLLDAFLTRGIDSRASEARKHRIGEGAGGTGVAASSTAIGAGIGTVIAPGLGTAFGAYVGAVIGAIVVGGSNLYTGDAAFIPNALIKHYYMHVD